MKTSIITALLAILSVSLQAATPEQEKAFVETYRKALEANDAAALASFLYTDGATKETVEFFSMMQSANAGQKVTSIELMPDGKKYKMPFPPSKQLVVVMEQKSGDGSSKSTSKSPVGEKNGKLVIPVPVPAK